MQVRMKIPDTKAQPCVIALGNFDGVHLGHRRLLEAGLAQAKQLGTGLSVLVFEPHPLKVLFPEQGIKLLTTREERLRAFEGLQVDTVYLLPFNRQMADTSPEEFVMKVLQPLGVVHVVVGFNYSFGAKGKGTAEDLIKLGQAGGFDVSVLEAQSINGRLISSSGIRKALLQGDVRTAKAMLGRSPCLCGTVVHGEERGRLLGFPTANLQPPEDLLVPKRGVYAVWSEIGGQRVAGMMNIGMKPTFHRLYETTIEVNFFDFNGDLYEHNLVVHIEEKLRDERKFNGIDELRRQLNQDADKVRKVLAGIK